MNSTNDTIPVQSLFTAAEMRTLDAATIASSVPGIVLMENAGAACANAILDRCGNDPAVILCGRGNNGGDGFVIARRLAAAGTPFEVWLLGAPKSIKGDAALALAAWKKAGGTIRLLDSRSLAAFRKSVANATVGVDALFGTGLNTAVDGLAAKALAALSGSQFRVAVDIPSGIQADTGAVLGAAFTADLTVTFGGLKVGLAVTPGVEHGGEVMVADIGLGAPPTGMRHGLILPEIESELFPQRAISGHKGDFGHLLLVAGSKGRTGAALMAAESALRMGAALVALAAPDSLLPIYANGLREAMTQPVPDDGTGRFLAASADILLAAAKGKSAIVVGPGINNDSDAADWLGFLLPRWDVPVLIDADGLNVLARLPKWDVLLKHRAAPTVLTPHPGEMARLMGGTAALVQSNRVSLASEAARRSGSVVVLKGARTIIAAPDGRILVNPTGCPEMATAGMGDVLSGIIGGLLAQRRDALWSAAAGTHYHGALAARLVENGQRRIIAGDVIAEIARGE